MTFKFVDVHNKTMTATLFVVLFVAGNVVIGVEDNNDATKNVISTIDCDESKDVCWPKCCFSYQFFDVNTKSCIESSEHSLLLHEPDIYSMR